MNGVFLGLLALGLFAATFGLWYQRIRRVDIPSDRRGYVAATLIAAGLGIAAFTQSPGWLGGIAAAAAVVAASVFALTILVSPQRVAADAIQIGETLRDFTATDEHGCEFALASTAGRPVLLKFFRGHW